ncbi:pilin [Phocoenobacter skyensis]|nr:prepilin-type N-terminal cleavage/methylation domain-containing protein [Pasteurella skyensis]MDP8079751.1 prepilin-type N-terminal cleavage/methylation domain-containing protein [Pasteurella skyensis]MDP8085674.1 prepilin-type N-terminal cleavage/methylation domain-containing protein [Pasteurella skyensis]MDP8162998.1 prepilin-type N-terminal cleavage/methylation domain-containing protein [Pasteurella skyensis]MDP8170074.1 prepilin-type N-terminal cleavage/methylation domain-containing prot
MQKSYLRLSQAFTLIELMIVIAIVAILAVVAMPSYTSYTQKAVLSEILTASAPYKSDVEICIYNMGEATNCNGGSNGIQADKSSSDTKYLKSIATSKGIITVEGKGTLKDYSYTLTPTYANNSIVWTATCAGEDTGIFPANFCSN